MNAIKNQKGLIPIVSYLLSPSWIVMNFIPSGRLQWRKKDVTNNDEYDIVIAFESKPVTLNWTYAIGGADPKSLTIRCGYVPK